MQAMLLDKGIKSVDEIPETLKKALAHAVQRGLCSPGKEVVVLTSSFVASTGAFVNGLGCKVHSV